MRKAGKIAFVGAFCAVIGLAFPVFNVFSKQLSMDSHENRLMTGLPQMLNSRCGNCRGISITFWWTILPSATSLCWSTPGWTMRCSAQARAIRCCPASRAGCFIRTGPNAAQPMANYQGLTELNDSAEVLAEASAGLQILNDRLAANGCTLVLDLTPSKDRIYREYMPDGYPIVNRGRTAPT